MSLVGIPLLSLVGIPLLFIAQVVCDLGRSLWSLTRPLHHVHTNPLDRLVGRVTDARLTLRFALRYLLVPYARIWLSLLYSLAWEACQYIRNTYIYGWLPRRGELLMRRNYEQEIPDDSEKPPSLYVPLVGDSDIRILLIESATSLDAPFVLSLRPVDLFSRPKYDALSYTWADEDGDDTRTVPVDIRRDLSPAEDRSWKNIRHRGNNRGNNEDGICQANTMWIDALCINQADVAERTHQVSLMSRIFMGAENVVVYTGEATPLTHMLFDALNQLPEDEIAEPSRFTGLMKHAMFWKNAAAQTPRPEQLSLSQIADSELFSSHNLAELAMTYFSRRWFTRVWVLQEVALPDPRRTRILCGAKTTTAMRALRGSGHLPARATKPAGAEPSVSVATRHHQDALLTAAGHPDRHAGPPGSGPARPDLRRPEPSQRTGARGRDQAGAVAAIGTGEVPGGLRAEHRAGFFLALLLPRKRNAVAAPHDDIHEAAAKLPTWAADWSSGSRWLNTYALRGFELACSTRENPEGDDVWFRNEEQGQSGRRVMMLQGKRRIKRGWFSRHVFDAEIGQETPDAIEEVTSLKSMDPSLVLVEMYPGVAALLSKLEEDTGVYGFQQTCAHAETKEDVAGIIRQWSNVVVKGGTKHVGTADYLAAPEAFTIW
ncbi:HET-domain-containing protein [Apiospora marii]|uniref:HET-domain-containing protein n=1 Tax=Apiospora marii TaxID=335849 RepID=A0ABR1R4E9_9PEZI